MLNHARYEIVSPLGSGGSARVFRARDREAPARALVAKVLTPTAARDLLDAEFALLSRVRIPGLVRAHDFGRDSSGTPFLIEDFVDAEPFDDVIGHESERLKAWFIDVLVTLATLHEAGFVHGDLKPEHVLLSGGRPVLVDLGAALEIASGEGPVGITRAYAAPEVVAGNAPDVRSDLYALGATVVALLGAPAARDPATTAARTTAIRRAARWLAPSLAEIVATLLAPHPIDRPADARAALALLGRDPSLRWDEGGRTCVGRERAIAEILEPTGSSVRYVVGPSGAGKSHTLREAGLRALAAGREVRVLRFPLDDQPVLPALVAFLRGAGPSPFVIDDRKSLLVVLDDLQRAPADVMPALDAYRCRVPHADGFVLACGARAAPGDATTIPIGALDAASFARLCDELGVDDDDEVARLNAMSSRLPGWVVAALGRVPLSREAAMDRLRDAPEPARAALFALAVCDAGLDADQVKRIIGGPSSEPLGHLARAGLIRRRDERVELSSGHLADDLSRALATFELADRLATALLGEVDVPARALLRAANIETPPARRLDLLMRAADRAAETGQRQEELDALFSICATPSARTLERVLRLERLARDSGQGRIHPQVLGWLDELAATSPDALALGLRRRAEVAAREGKIEEATAIANEAVSRSSRGAAQGYALSTRGAVALYHGDYASADEALQRARSTLSGIAGRGEPLDREEVARLEHNHGVVALARGRLREAALAFERSTVVKRELGDRAGVRSCLLNLGLTLAKLGDHDRAQATLDEAIRLAHALDQKGGLAWCLAARADLEVRRDRAEEAARFVAEAAALGDHVPPVVRADLCLLRAEIAVLEGDAARAQRALSELDGTLVASDAWLSIRAAILEARATLVRVPVDRLACARLAIGAVRRARIAALPELEAAAREVLTRVRHRRGTTPRAPAAPLRYDWGVPNDSFAILERFAAGAEPDAAIIELLIAARAATSAERAFLVVLADEHGEPRAFGVDLDDEPIADAARRASVSFETEASSGSIYQRELTTKAGRGSRLVSFVPEGAPRVALVLEHRFQVGAFDRVDVADVHKWCVLGAVLARASANGTTAEPRADATRARPAAPSPAAAATTDVPLREARRDFPALIGTSIAMRRALAKLDAACDADLPVVLTGETGTGKELFARALHESGRRAKRAFVAVNCAAIPDALFEAELFGHARGAFTGADKARPGLFVKAEGGTLFLDEIAELSPARQASLLRALETRLLRPVGSDEERPFDVRLVSATHQDLDAAVERGAFRADLLYRLRVLSIEIPALREREGDIALLARSFLRQAGSRAELSKRALSVLGSYRWPGNVRELSHVMQRLAALDLDRLEARHLPRAIRAGAVEPVTHLQPESDQRGEIERALASTGGNISHAANLLGVTRQGLKKRMARLGLKRGAE